MVNNQIRGKAGCPLHEDGSPVVTHTLKKKLKPLELDLYSADPLTLRLWESLYPEIGNDSYDSWGIQDFVAYGLEQAAKYWLDSPGAVVYWTRRELWKRKKRDKRYLLTNDFWPTPVEPDVQPNRLPLEVHQWLVLHLPTDVAEVFAIAAERDVPLSTAAELLGTTPDKVYRYTSKLRTLIEGDNGV